MIPLHLCNFHLHNYHQHSLLHSEPTIPEKYLLPLNILGQVVQKSASLTLGLLKYSNKTFHLIAYEVEHVFPQIFSQPK